MRLRVIWIFWLFSITISCEKRNWNNPFDLASPKSLFTPTNFFITSSGATLILNWNLSNKQISGFLIEREYSPNNYSVIANLPPESKSYIDAAITSNTIYKYRLTAIAGLNQSNTVQTSFKTANVPKILQFSELNKTFSSIKFSTDIEDGGSPVLSKGICWSTSPNPTINNSKTNDGQGSDNFYSTIQNLNTNTKYFFRSYATNAFGTNYGTEISVILYLNQPGPTSVDGSGNKYNSVQIGDQTWISKNLFTTKYQNGTNIPNIIDSKTWTNLTTGAFCDFNNDINIGNVYGHLYNYYSVSDSRNICPTGWHVPTKIEWETLINYLGGPALAGIKLKETGSLYWLPANATGDNSSGFSARAGAWRSQDALFYYGVKAGGALFWTSTKDDTKYPWVMGIQIFDGTGAAKIVKDAYFESAAGTSIRCIKN